MLTSLPTAYKIHIAVRLKIEINCKKEMNRRNAFSAEIPGCASLGHFLQPANKHPPVCKNLAFNGVYLQVKIVPRYTLFVILKYPEMIY